MPRFGLVALLSSITLVVSGAAHAADPWNDVGTPGRPSWVEASAERRLRLLSALPAIESAVKKAADAYIGALGPGMSVGLVLDSGLYYSRGFGFRDAAKTAVPDENTIFRAGSLSKVMTATGLLTLIDDGAHLDAEKHPLTLNTPADGAGFLPELKWVCPIFDLQCPRAVQALGVTLGNLTSHTAGLPNVMEQTHASIPQWLTDLQKTWIQFPHGARSAYSGVGIEAVGLIESRISGKSYVDFIKDNLFSPLGMKHSSMDETTLPSSERAQKWMFSLEEKDPCRTGCMTEEQDCMKTANTGPERGECAKQQLACTAKCPTPTGFYTFMPFSGRIAGDDQPMIAPAGGLATNVADMGRFMRMWLSGNAPEVDGKPLLKLATIKGAANPYVAADAPGIPPGCNIASAVADSNGWSFSSCASAAAFGVGWSLRPAPFIQHNGDEPGLSGSNTVLDQTKKMGGTLLISTEPYPAADALSPIPQGLDVKFADTVVYDDLLGAGETADASTTWAGQTLADGVARLLYLLGKPPGVNDLAGLSASFVSANKLTPGTIVGFLMRLQGAHGACGTFRVVGATSTTVELVLSCQKSEWRTTLTIEASSPHQISWIPVGLPAPPVNTQCVEACGIEEGRCMNKAHSVADRQLCIKDTERCAADCAK